MSIDIGQLVVLETQWNINSNLVGVVISREKHSNDIVLVLWTTKDGVKIKKHIQEILLPVTPETIRKIEARICSIK